MEIYIIRHGETVWNAKKLLQGSTDIELNEKGRELAGITGRNLEEVRFDKIYSSPLIRAYETACLIRGHRNIPIIRDERLRELCFGSNEGKDFSKLLADEENPFHYFFKQPELYQAPADGETLEHICTRAAEFLEEVVEPQWKELERIMIVAHGAMNKALMCHIKQHGIDQYWSGGLHRAGPCSCTGGRKSWHSRRERTFWSGAGACRADLCAPERASGGLNSAAQ